MAVLGAQLVLTLITISIIQKLTPHFSFAKWILCSTGLQRYLHPTDDELRTKAGVPKERPSKSNGKNGSKPSKNGISSGVGQFHIPRNLDVELERTPVVVRDVIHLRYFTEYQWLLDFSMYAGLVYMFSEIYHYFIPLQNETNLSMVWCLLVVFFAVYVLKMIPFYFIDESHLNQMFREMHVDTIQMRLPIDFIISLLTTHYLPSVRKLLSSLTVLYFQSEESIGERSMVIVACLVYLLIAMVVLIVDERILETGLEQAYNSFNESASKFLSNQGLSSSGPASKIVVKFFIAIACGLLGSLFTFPGLRMAKMHWDSLKYCKDSRLMQLLLNISFVLPFILVILWIRPISRDYLTERVFDGMDRPLLKPHIFETMRLLLVVLVVILRFCLMPIYLQAYLNLAYDRILELRKEAGRITNIEYQKKISSIFYYLCVVTLQFAAPLVLCLYLTLMYKSLGGFSWTGLFQESVLQHECAADAAPEGTIAENEIFEGSEISLDATEVNDDSNFNVLESAQLLQASIVSLKNVFTTEVYKGLLGFATWWSYFTLFATSLLGIVYQSYFNKT